MRFSPSDFPQSKTDRGFTLIEVVVGITLMATVLATSLLAFSAHQKQIRQARVKLTALQVADEMLNRMSSSREGIPVSGAGPIPEHPNWSWQTSVVGQTIQFKIPLQIIQLSIYENQGDSEVDLLASTRVIKAINP